MSFANAAMLLGMFGVAIPVVIHLLSRRRVPTIAWGAMQFLDLGPRARTRRRLAEWLLLAARMLLLALVVLAAARPIWSSGIGPIGGPEPPKDVVIVFDASDRMVRRGGGTSPMAEALRSVESLVDRLGPGDAVAIVRSGNRARAILDPPSVDRSRIRAAMANLPAPRGTADLPSAIGEAFRILEQSGRQASSEVIVLTDGDRNAWRLDEPGRWRLLRSLHGRLPVAPRIRIETFDVPIDPEAADGQVIDLRTSRGLIAPGGTIRVGATVRNLGPGSLERSANLVIDGEPVPGSSRAVGPLPPGGSVSVEFQTSMAEVGSVAIGVQLSAGGTPDPLPMNDESTTVVEVAEALPVLLVDGDPGNRPMTGEVDFLRAALMPPGGEAPRVRASVMSTDHLDAETLAGFRVLVLANVDRMTAGQGALVASWVEQGGGVLVVPGGRTDRDFWNREAYQEGRGWLPAQIGPRRGEFADRSTVARPAPETFAGGLLGTIGRGETTLGSAVLFSHFELEPAESDPPASVLARLDSGAPWLVERPFGSGRSAILAAPLDAEGGTLPANPDFVPFAHELVYRLADPEPDTSATRAGAPLVVPLDLPPADLPDSIPVLTPSGRVAEAPVDRSSETAVARFSEADEPGLYRFDLPGRSAYRLVTPDHPSPPPSPLSFSEIETLADGWPLSFDIDASQPSPSRTHGPARSSQPLWRGLLLAALAVLCLEVWLTRRLSRHRKDLSL